MLSSIDPDERNLAELQMDLKIKYNFEKRVSVQFSQRSLFGLHGMQDAIIDLSRSRRENFRVSGSRDRVDLHVFPGTAALRAQPHASPEEECKQKDEPTASRDSYDALLTHPRLALLGGDFCRRRGVVWVLALHGDLHNRVADFEFVLYDLFLQLVGHSS